jgi:O-antigen/teichoic acid export membrane protein
MNSDVTLPNEHSLAGELRKNGLTSDNLSPDNAFTDRLGLDLASLPIRSLKCNILSNALANFVKGGCQIGLVIGLAKLGNAEMVGQYALGVAVAWPVFLLADLQLRVVQATDAQDDFHFGHYLGLRLLTSPLAFLVVIGLIWVLGYRWETSLVIGGVALSRGLDSVRDCIHGAMQKNERLDLVSISTIMRNLGSFGIFITVFYTSGLLLLAVLSQAVAGTLVFLAFDCPRGAKVLGLQTGIWIPRFDRRVLLQLARLALPLGMVMMIISINANLPRYLLEHSLGEGAVGIFAALSQPTLAGGMVMAALGHSIMPRMARGFAGGNLNYLSKMVWRLIGFGGLLGGVMMVVVWGWGREIISLIYRPEYAEHQTTLLWLMAAGIIGYVSSGLGYGINSSREYFYYLIFYLISAFLGAILGMLLIPAFGLKGAAWTVCGTNLLSCLFLGWLFFVLRRTGGRHAARKPL